MFTITKHHRGAPIWVGGATFMVNGQRQPYIKKAEAEARSVQTRLRGLATPTAVRPINALVGASQLTVKTAPRWVSVMHASRLPAGLLGLPSMLSMQQQHVLEAFLSDDRAWATSTGPDEVDHARFRRLQQEVEQARQRRMLWFVLGVLLPIPGGIAALTLLHSLLTMVSMLVVRR